MAANVICDNEFYHKTALTAQHTLTLLRFGIIWISIRPSNNNIIFERVQEFGNILIALLLVSSFSQTIPHIPCEYSPLCMSFNYNYTHTYIHIYIYIYIPQKIFVQAQNILWLKTVMLWIYIELNFVTKALAMRSDGFKLSYDITDHWSSDPQQPRFRWYSTKWPLAFKDQRRLHVVKW